MKSEFLSLPFSLSADCEMYLDVFIDAINDRWTVFELFSSRGDAFVNVNLRDWM